MSIINNIMNKTQELISGNSDDTNPSDVGDVGNAKDSTLEWQFSHSFNDGPCLL